MDATMQAFVGLKSRWTDDAVTCRQLFESTVFAFSNHYIVNSNLIKRVADFINWNRYFKKPTQSWILKYPVSQDGGWSQDLLQYNTDHANFYTRYFTLKLILHEIHPVINLGSLVICGNIHITPPSSVYGLNIYKISFSTAYNIALVYTRYEKSVRVFETYVKVS